MFSKASDKPFCPLLKGDCVEARCLWWVHLRGKNPQTGAEIDTPGCAIGWLPILLIENAQEVRQAAAAVESSRNENVDGLRRLTDVIKEARRLATTRTLDVHN